MRLGLMMIILLLMTAFDAGAQTAPKFGGVGIDGVPLGNGEILVRQLVAGGPASRSGVRTGDVISHVDGRPTKGRDFNTMVQRELRGRPGTTVRLTVRRPTLARPLYFNVARRQMIPPKR